MDINKEAFDYLTEEHCCMEDCKEIKSKAYCDMDDSISCEDCWVRYLKFGRWWDEISEPDPDRKWKEMRESD